MTFFLMTGRGGNNVESNKGVIWSGIGEEGFVFEKENDNGNGTKTVIEFRIVLISQPGWGTSTSTTNKCNKNQKITTNTQKQYRISVLSNENVLLFCQLSYQIFEPYLAKIPSHFIPSYIHEGSSISEQMIMGLLENILKKP